MSFPSKPLTGQYLTPRQLGEELGVSECTLSQWRSQSKGPAYLRIAYNKVRYSRAAVDAWLASITVSQKAG